MTTRDGRPLLEPAGDPARTLPHTLEMTMTDPKPTDRREQYAAALYATLEVSPTRHPWETLSPFRRAVWYARADAAMAVADAERAVVEPPADRADLRQHLADALYPTYGQQDRNRSLDIADAVVSVLPADTDRAAVLREAANRLDERAEELTQAARKDPLAFAIGASDARYHSADCWNAAAGELRRMADETPAAAVDLPTLAAALDGLHTLIATRSRDWQTYRVDAWLWAVLCGWDCEQAEHDDTCTHGALEETAAMHGWDDATVAKARRYRAAVRALTDTAAGARQDGAQS